MGRNGNAKISSAVWKEVGVNPFNQSMKVDKEMSLLGSSKFMVPKFRVFKVGGSSDPTISSFDRGVHGDK